MLSWALLLLFPWFTWCIYGQEYIMVGTEGETFHFAIKAVLTVIIVYMPVSSSLPNSHTHTPTSMWAHTHTHTIFVNLGPYPNKRSVKICWVSDELPFETPSAAYSISILISALLVKKTLICSGGDRYLYPQARGWVVIGLNQCW